MLDGGPLNEYGDSVIAEVGRATAAQIAGLARRPTGIVALNDLMALGLMAGLRDAGLAVPRDVSVVGIDGLFLAALSSPMLTTVQLPVREMARAMVEIAIRPDAGTTAVDGDRVVHAHPAGRARVGRATAGRQATSDEARLRQPSERQARRLLRRARRARALQAIAEVRFNAEPRELPTPG